MEREGAGKEREGKEGWRGKVAWRGQWKEQGQREGMQETDAEGMQETDAGDECRKVGSRPADMAWTRQKRSFTVALVTYVFSSPASGGADRTPPP